MAARLLRRKVVSEINGPFHDVGVLYPQIRPLLPLLDRASLTSARLSHSLIVPTAGLGDWLESRGVSTPWTIIPAGANPNEFSGEVDRAELDVGKGPFTVFVGSLTPWQGLELMAAATDEPTWPDDVPLLIVGGTPTGAVSELPYGRKVRYLGPRSHDEAMRLLDAATVSLSLKSLDSVHARCGQAPVKVYESLAAGTPVIGTALHGQAEIINESGCGTLVPPDPEAIARAVHAYTDNPIRSQDEGERGRCWIASGHTWRHRVNETEEQLSQLLA